MKKVFALMMVCGFAFAFVACGGSTSDQPADTAAATIDTVAAAPAAVDTAAVDSAQ